MSRFSSLFAALTAGSSIAAVSATPPANAAVPPAVATAAAAVFADLDISAEDKAQLTAELATALTEVSSAQEAKGFKAGNDRAVQVLSSDKGKAHSGIALSLLGNDKMSALTGEDIIAALPEVPIAATTTTTTDAPDPAAAAAAAAAAAGGGSGQHQRRLAASPHIALGNRGATAHEVDEPTDRGAGASKEQVASVWGKAQNVTKGGMNGGAANVTVQPVQ